MLCRPHSGAILSWKSVPAPTLFAELLLDGVLSASLYRRLSRVERWHWLETAVRRTVWPFILTAVMAFAVGWVLQDSAPEARSIGDVVGPR